MTRSLFDRWTTNWDDPVGSRSSRWSARRRRGNAPGS